MKTILVPIDFSPAAENACNVAKVFAQKMHATIHLAHFYTIPVADYSYPDISMSAEIMEQTRKVALSSTEETAKALRAEGYTVTTTVDTGLASDEIVQLGEQIQADLIIMGTTGASGIINKLIGSNAAHVMQRTTRPILLLPVACNVSTMHKVVYLDELKEDDTRVLAQLFALGDDLGFTAIRLLNINTGFFYQPIDAQLIAKIEAVFGSNKIKLENIDGIDVKEGIEHYLENHKIDLIVMSTHKKSFLERIFSKGDTYEMALYSKIPLLVYHKQE